MSNARWNVIAHFSFSERAARTNRAVCSKSIVRSCFRQPITKPLAPFSFKILISEFWLFFSRTSKIEKRFFEFQKNQLSKKWARMSSLPPVVTTATDRDHPSAPPSGGKKECLGFIASRSNFRHHRRQPGAKLPPKREFWNQKFDTKLHNLITWVNKPDNPLDLRSTAPVSRHKPLYKGNIKLTVSSHLHKNPTYSN